MDDVFLNLNIDWTINIQAIWNINSFIKVGIKKTFVVLCFVYIGVQWRLTFCRIKCLSVLRFVLWCPLRLPHKIDVRFFFTSSGLLEGSSYLRYLCLFVYSGVRHILCCAFLFCLSSSCVSCYMLPVSLDWPFLIAPLTFIYKIINHDHFCRSYGH